MGGDQLVQPAEAGQPFRQPPRCHPLTGLIHQIEPPRDTSQSCDLQSNVRATHHTTTSSSAARRFRLPPGVTTPGSSLGHPAGRECKASSGAGQSAPGRRVCYPLRSEPQSDVGGDQRARDPPAMVQRPGGHRGAALRRSQSAAAILTSCLPRFSPVNRRLRASGAFSSPSTTSIWFLIFPSPAQPASTPIASITRSR